MGLGSIWVSMVVGWKYRDGWHRSDGERNIGLGFLVKRFGNFLVL